jgi:acyl-CoA thioester hydrolase
MSGDGLGRYPISIAIPVAWGEMDAFQHVNNVTYARWLESARIAYFDRIGLLESMRLDGVGPILAKLAIQYRRPVTFPDTVRVETTVTRIGNTSFDVASRIRSQVLGVEVATDEEVIVLLDYRTGKPTPVSAKLRAAIAALERSGG